MLIHCSNKICCDVHRWFSKASDIGLSGRFGEVYWSSLIRIKQKLDSLNSLTLVLLTTPSKFDFVVGVITYEGRNLRLLSCLKS